MINFFEQGVIPESRDYVRILIPRGLLVMDFLFLLLFSLLTSNSGGAKAPSAPPPSNVVPALS